jgi:hypothetical protein
MQNGMGWIPSGGNGVWVKAERSRREKEEGDMENQ